MAYMMVDFSNEIEKIILEFEEEMSRVKGRALFAAIYSKNPPTATQNYVRQKQQANMERENALRRALYRVLGTKEQQEQMFMSPAQRAAQQAFEGTVDKINSRGGITIDVEF